MFLFTVIDPQTNRTPDLRQIALTEAWAHDLVYCDMEGFAITGDGVLLLLDECGTYRYCPPDRFQIVLARELQERQACEPSNP